MQKEYVILDGTLHLVSDTLVPIYSSRAAKYGDGFFETIHYHNGKALYFHLHYQRMSKTARLLKFDFPQHWTEEYFIDLLNKLAKANNLNSGRVSLSFYRDTDGYYLPKDKVFRYHASITKKEEAKALYQFNNKGLILGEYKELVKTNNFLSALKTNNALIYVLAAIFAKHHQYDECLIFNEAGRVAECISANIILVYGDKLVSPPISEYGLDGVMKKVIMQKAAAYGYKIEEYPIYAEDLFGADEVIITNVMQGLKWVQNYKGKTFSNAIAKQLFTLIND